MDDNPFEHRRADRQTQGVGCRGLSHLRGKGMMTGRDWGAVLVDFQIKDFTFGRLGRIIALERLETMNNMKFHSFFVTVLFLVLASVTASADSPKMEWFFTDHRPNASPAKLWDAKASIGTMNGWYCDISAVVRRRDGLEYRVIECRASPQETHSSMAFVYCSPKLGARREFLTLGTRSRHDARPSYAVVSLSCEPPQ